MQKIALNPRYLICLILSILGCAKNEESSTNREEGQESANYDFIRSLENSYVESKLIQFSQGTWYNALDYNQEHAYERLNIAFMTDSHLDLGEVEASKQNVIDAIDFCNNVRVPISIILEGGDLTTYARGKTTHINELKRFFDMGWKAKMPLLYTKGNHDLNTMGVSPENSLNDKDWSEIWFNEAEERYNIVRNINKNGQKSSYYYYDLAEWKVRIICVDCLDLDLSRVDDNGKVLYSCGTSFYIGNDQFNWIAQTALNFDDKQEKDWGVIVFMHYFNLNIENGTSVSPAFLSSYPSFLEMLKSFNEKQMFKYEYVFPDNHFYDISVSGDWTRYSTGAEKPYFICLLSGHVHTDDYNNYNGINHIVTANQFCGEEYCDIRINRLAGTITQNLFDIINIDIKQRRIRVIRYGAGVNCYGVGGDRFLPEGIGF